MNLVTKETLNELVTQKYKTSIVQTHVQLLFPIRRHFQLLFQLDVDYIVAAHIILTILFLFWYYLTFNLIKKKHNNETSLFSIKRKAR